MKTTDTTCKLNQNNLILLLLLSLLLLLKIRTAIDDIEAGFVIGSGQQVA